jgi:hypothetical protein
LGSESRKIKLKRNIMKLDAREDMTIAHFWEVYDKDTGKSMAEEHIIAADDSTGQVIRYEYNNNRPLLGWPVVSEIRNIELVYTEWNK